MIVSKKGNKHIFIREHWTEWFRIKVSGAWQIWAKEKDLKLPRGFVELYVDKPYGLSIYYIWPLAPFVFSLNIIKYCWFSLASRVYRAGYLNSEEGDPYGWSWPKGIKFKK